MADVKISGLPASTTPLAGTEVLPIVQGGQTRQVSVANLTTGRAVSATDLTLTGVATVPAGTVGAPSITTTGDTNTGIFFPAADTIAFSKGGAEAMRIFNTGGVSIGNTTDPGATNLSVTGLIKTATWNGATIGTGYGGTGLTSFTTNGVMYGASTSTLATSTKLTWENSSGYLGIGIYPGAPLHIYSTGNPPIFVDQYSTDGNGANYIGRKARGTLASPLAVAADDFIVSMSARGYGTTVMGGANVGLMGYRAAEAFTDTAQGTYFSLGTTPVGTTSRAERIRIFASGGVSIGNATDPGIGNLRVNGKIKTGGYTVATLPAGVVGDIAYVTDATAPTYLGALIGGGAVTCPVFFNGTAWVSA